MRSYNINVFGYGEDFIGIKCTKEEAIEYIEMHRNGESLDEIFREHTDAYMGFAFDDEADLTIKDNDTEDIIIDDLCDFINQHGEYQFSSYAPELEDDEVLIIYRAIYKGTWVDMNFEDKEIDFKKFEVINYDVYGCDYFNITGYTNSNGDITNVEENCIDNKAVEVGIYFADGDYCEVDEDTPADELLRMI